MLTDTVLENAVPETEAVSIPSTRLERARYAASDARTWFRGFRRSRPFWGGLWMLVGAYFLLDMSMVPIQLVVKAGLTGLGGWLTGGTLLLCGLTTWFFPTQKLFAGVIGLLVAIVSIVVSNLGGLFLGMFFGVIGASMTLGWGPAKPRTFGRKKKVTDEAAAQDTELEEIETPA
ncbi:MAG: DUF6114 domain-containing protein [Nocardiaceae bacterium]|nr:DUF6114 domain-containing protein [Nocardiaceae bacterium]